MKLLKRLFRKESIELPDLPELPKLSKKKGKLPTYPVDVHKDDLDKIRGTVKRLEEEMKEVSSLRKDLDVFKKMKLVDFDKMKKQLDEGGDLRKEIEEINKSLQDLQEDVRKNKKGNAVKELQSQIAELEAEVVLLQESNNAMKLKEELLPFIQAKVVQHVFESKYDPREIKSMKKQVLSYIERAIDSGHSEEKVKRALSEKGWPEELVAAYYDLAYDEKLRK